MRSIFIVFVTIFFSCSNSKHVIKYKSGKVYFIPTLHGYHKINTQYNYDTLKAVVARLNPEIIAVEIRQADMDSDSNYLKKNYPYEMRMMHYWFPSSEVVGFDWLGEDIEGKQIPDDYWKEVSAIKKMERAFDKDSVIIRKTKDCFARFTERDSLLQTLSLQELIKSNDATIVNQQYKCLEETTKDSPYEEMTKFYKQRNEKILESILSITKKYHGKRIVILTGDDHYVALKDRFPHDRL